MRAVIVGIAGPVLAPAEVTALRQHPPAGVILFRRNIAAPAQLAALMAALRDVLPPGAVLMVDQEGGRVARLRPPHWRAHPPAASVGRLWQTQGPAAAQRAAWLCGALIGWECRAAGFDVVCAPVLDRRIAGASDAIGDRAFAAEPEVVAALGAAMAQGLLAAGIQPVAKHAPGHGRATVDSHLALPVVTGETAEHQADLLPFRRNADLPWMMTAHIRYPAWDPAQPATLSPAIIGPILRGQVGFGGVLVSDDLSMQALDGPPAARMCRALAAGCDIALFGTGEAEPTADVLHAAPPLTPQAQTRLDDARTLAAARTIPLDATALADERDRLLP